MKFKTAAQEFLRTLSRADEEQEYNLDLLKKIVVKSIRMYNCTRANLCDPIWLKKARVNLLKSYRKNNTKCRLLRQFIVIANYTIPSTANFDSIRLSALHAYFCHHTFPTCISQTDSRIHANTDEPPMSNATKVVSKKKRKKIDSGNGHKKLHKDKKNKLDMQNTINIVHKVDKPAGKPPNVPGSARKLEWIDELKSYATRTECTICMGLKYFIHNSQNGTFCQTCHSSYKHAAKIEGRRTPKRKEEVKSAPKTEKDENFKRQKMQIECSNDSIIVYGIDKIMRSFGLTERPRLLIENARADLYNLDSRTIGRNCRWLDGPLTQKMTLREAVNIAAAYPHKTENNAFICLCTNKIGEPDLISGHRIQNANGKPLEGKGFHFLIDR